MTAMNSEHLENRRYGPLLPTVVIQDSGYYRTDRGRSLSHETEFGWVFPDLEPEGRSKKQVIIDAQWLEEYNEDIVELQVLIDKKRQLCFGNHGHKDPIKEENIDTKPTCQVVLSSSSKQHDETLETVKVNVKKQSSLTSADQEEVDCGKSETCSVSTLNDSGFEDFIEPDRMMETQKLPVDCPKEVQELNLSENDSETRSTSPQSEACCSMHSLASRDSGVYATEETPEVLFELPMDRSLLEELEEYFSDNDLPFDNFFINMPRGGATEAVQAEEGKRGNKCPVWFQKFSEDDDLSTQFRSINWDTNRTAGESSLQSSGDRETKGAEVDPVIDSEDAEETDTEGKKDVQSRQHMRNVWAACDKMEALSLSGNPVSKGVSEMIQLVMTFSMINDRLQDLRYGLHSLALEAHHSKSDFKRLETEASRLLTSTASSRQNMTQLYALQELENRLQEEWWAAYNPNVIPLHENYIV